MALDGQVRRWAAASLLVVAALYGRETGQSLLAAGVAADHPRGARRGARAPRALSSWPSASPPPPPPPSGRALGWVLVPDDGRAPPRSWPPRSALAGLPRGRRPPLPPRTPPPRPPRPCSPASPPSPPAERPPSARSTAPSRAVHLASALLALHESAAGPIARSARGGASRPARRPQAEPSRSSSPSPPPSPPASASSPCRRPRSGRRHASLRSLGEPETGFSDRMGLRLPRRPAPVRRGRHAPRRPLRRGRSRPPTTSRGAVYDHYEIGNWGRRHPARPTPLHLDPSPAPGADRVRITVRRRRPRPLLPLPSAPAPSPPPSPTSPSIATPSAAGLVQTRAAHLLKTFLRPGPPPPELPLDPPGDDDLALPPDLRRALERIAAEWTAGAATPEARVSAIADHLRTRFTYSLFFTPAPPPRLPLLDFLLDDHRGHREYFGSAPTPLAARGRRPGPRGRRLPRRRAERPRPLPDRPRAQRPRVGRGLPPRPRLRHRRRHPRRRRLPERAPPRRPGERALHPRRRPPGRAPRRGSRCCT